MTFRKTALLVLIAAFAVPSIAGADSYVIDPGHSSAHFKVSHLVVSTVHGEFSGVSGTLDYDANTPEKSIANVTIDATTVNTRNEKRDNHLRSADFFDVKKFPTMSFKSTKISKKRNGLQLTGELTIHGITKTATFVVEGPTGPVANPWSGKATIGANATTTISRKEFGLNWNKALEAGGVLVGDEIEITISMELVAE